MSIEFLREALRPENEGRCFSSNTFTATYSFRRGFVLTVLGEESGRWVRCPMAFNEFVGQHWRWLDAPTPDAGGKVEGERQPLTQSEINETYQRGIDNCAEEIGRLTAQLNKTNDKVDALEQRCEALEKLNTQRAINKLQETSLCQHEWDLPNNLYRTCKKCLVVSRW